MPVCSASSSSFNPLFNRKSFSRSCIVVVWIQTNCIGHKSYNIIIDLVRKYSRKVRYFAYASATKCAEQVVEEEENTDK